MADTAPRQRDNAYSSFTEKLLARDIQPGQFMSQRELVALTGMPLGAIREMIPRLEADGLIRTSPKRGLQVLTIDIDLVRNAFQLRRIIEGEAIAEFTRSASDEDIQRLAAEHGAVQDDARKNGIDAALVDRAQHIDWAFHDRIVDHLKNDIISGIHRVNAIKIRLIRNADTRLLPELLISVMDEHIQVINALIARDEAAAVTALHAHIDSAKRRALAI